MAYAFYMVNVSSIRYILIYNMLIKRCLYHPYMTNKSGAYSRRRHVFFQENRKLFCSYQIFIALFFLLNLKHMLPYSLNYLSVRENFKLQSFFARSICLTRKYINLLLCFMFKTAALPTTKPTGK